MRVCVYGLCRTIFLFYDIAPFFFFTVDDGGVGVAS